MLHTARSSSSGPADALEVLWAGRSPRRASRGWCPSAVGPIADQGGLAPARRRADAARSFLASPRVAPRLTGPIGDPCCDCCRSRRRGARTARGRSGGRRGRLDEAAHRRRDLLSMFSANLAAETLEDGWPPTISARAGWRATKRLRQRLGREIGRAGGSGTCSRTTDRELEAFVRAIGSTTCGRDPSDGEFNWNRSVILSLVRQSGIKSISYGRSSAKRDGAGDGRARGAFENRDDGRRRRGSSWRCSSSLPCPCCSRRRGFAARSGRRALRLHRAIHGDDGRLDAPALKRVAYLESRPVIGRPRSPCASTPRASAPWIWAALSAWARCARVAHGAPLYGATAGVMAGIALATTSVALYVRKASTDFVFVFC